jgi:hypothetical protein
LPFHFNLGAADLGGFLFLALVFWWLRSSPVVGRGIIDTIRGVLGARDNTEPDFAQRESQPVRDRRYSVIRRLFIVLVALAGIISVVVALEE